MYVGAYLVYWAVTMCQTRTNIVVGRSSMLTYKHRHVTCKVLVHVVSHELVYASSITYRQLKVLNIPLKFEETELEDCYKLHYQLDRLPGCLPFALYTWVLLGVGALHSPCQIATWAFTWEQALTWDTVVW